jgi:hypothetical protein
MGPTGDTGPTGATGATGPASLAYAGANFNSASISPSQPRTNGVCLAGDTSVATVTVPTSATGQNGNYSLVVNGTATFTSGLGNARTVGVAITADGALQTPIGVGQLNGLGTDFSNATLTTLVTGLTSTSSHVIVLRGCSSGTNANIVTNTGTLSVMAAK